MQKSSNFVNNLIITLAHSLNQQTDFDEVLRLVALKTTEIVKGDSALVMMINPGTHETIKTIARKETSSNKKHIISAQRQITGWMLQEHKSFLTKDISTDNRFAKLKTSDFKGQSIIATLLKVENVVLGSLIVFRINSGSTFDKNDLEILENIAVIASPYLRNIKKIKEFFVPDLSENALLHKYNQQGMIGESTNFIRLLNAIEAATRSDVRVLLEGESGTGKELIAKAIHAFSERKDGPYIAVDCGTIPGHLIESELFGHIKGAFTGANQDRKGLIEEAEGGVLFIDEISNLPFEIQAKLMRFLQEKEIRPLGSNTTKKVDVRIISASSSSLNEMVDKGKFRQDLFYRLHVYPIYVPPLRERERDIIILANHFLDIFSNAQKKNLETIHPSVLEYLYKREWKGNIRELQNLMERFVTIASSDDTILKPYVIPNDLKESFKELVPIQPDENKTLKEQLLEYEERIIRQMLDEHNWNQSAAARALDISEAIIRYRMKRLGIKKNINRPINS